MRHSIAFAAALLLTGLSFSATCRAGAHDQVVRLVNHSDLDLSTPAGLRTLEGRIDQAANAVCLDVTGPSPAGQVHAACKAEAVRSARSQLERADAQQLRQPSPGVAAVQAPPTTRQR